jgi:hypothetical protein
MRELVKSIKAYKGKWIFSCRAAVFSQKKLRKLNAENKLEIYAKRREIALLFAMLLSDDPATVLKGGKPTTKDDRAKALEERYNVFHESSLDEFISSNPSADGYRILFRAGIQDALDLKLGEEVKRWRRHGKDIETPLARIYFRNFITKTKRKLLSNRLKSIILNNRIFEIMITNFDFRPPDYNVYKGVGGVGGFSYNEDHDTEYQVMTFRDFCRIVIPILYTELPMS